MKVRSRGVSITVQRDDAPTPTTYRLPLWGLWTVIGLAVGAGLVLIAGLAFYTPIIRQAARVPELTREVDRLTIDAGRVRRLAAALDSVEANYSRLRAMVGADVAPDPVRLGSQVPVAPTLLVRPASLRLRYEVGLSLPHHWPLDEAGYVTRGQIAPDSTTDEPHPGLDVAVPVGTLVRAAGGGTVLQTGEQAEYGLFILIEHPGGYQTMYGHLSRLVARAGTRVRAGEVIGRSGNSGRSSAPHLHFEIRLNGVAVDPLALVKDNR